MKDFNTLQYQGKNYTASELQVMAKEGLAKEDALQDFYAFVLQWLNEKNYVEVQSSGSTGTPKTLQIAKHKMLESARMTCTFLGLNESKAALCCLSCKHIGGMMIVVRAFYSGMNLWVEVPKANPLENFETKLDFIAVVPYQALAILENSPQKLKSIAKIIIGGGKVNYALQEKLLQENIEAYSTFGMTETLSHIALQKIGFEKNYQCLPGIQIATTAEGCLTIEAPNLIDKILTTNDLVNIVNTNCFEWLGRKDFAIESGGFKILPEQVEERLAPFIQSRFMIASLPDEKWNNKLILIVEGKKEIDTSIFEVLKNYERPKAIYYVDAFVEVANGKLDRMRTLELVK